MLKDIAVVGMAVMGKNLALNIADHGYSTLIYNRTTEVMEEVLNENKHPNLFGAKTLEELVAGLKKPRKIILMVKAGKAVDALLDQLSTLLDLDDIVIDAGNSFYEDTIAREKKYRELGLKFIGMGVSGGEEGARLGPAIMPGGDLEAHASLKEILEAISAKVNGEACTSYIGPNGAGHYVKMVHNGIEYGDMQLIAEAYQVLKKLGKKSNAELHQIFDRYNRGNLNSYLIEITRDILNTKDDLSTNDLIDVIKDTAGQKGTGIWTSRESLHYGETTSVITQAVYARFISANRALRQKASKVLALKATDIQDKELVDLVEKALYLSKVISYAQGFSLLKQASLDHEWKLNFKEIAKLFRGGCIIRAQFLNDIADAYINNPDLDNLLLEPYFSKIANESIEALRKVVSYAALAGVPVMAFSSALAYYDSFRSTDLSTNLIQAQRDYFGAHTYERLDRDGFYHFASWGKE